MTVSVHLAVRGLTKRFGSFVALRDINLEVGKGEFVCFLGPSGCGKTTLLRAIAGLDTQDAGSIHIGGRDVTRLPPAERDFGIVFQSYALFPNLTVAGNVGYGLVNRGMAKAAIAARTDELLRLVGLGDQGAKYPVQLSGGQQQRVALARALATSPGLLLLDEPLSALDAKVRVRLREEIKLVQKTLGVTTIMVTHDQEEALSMADRVVVMNQGAIEQVDSPEAIYRAPASEFVADFVGAMTFLDGVMGDGGGVDVKGMTFAVADGRGAAKGEVVRIGFRPEDVIFDDGAGNSFSARVSAREFLGSVTRVRLTPAGRTEPSFTADLPAGEAARNAAAIGAVVAVCLPPASLHVFRRRNEALS
jgi:iron(III) transport system ATP-binding protein